MKTKTPPGRAPKPRAPGKTKADPRQAHLPHVPGADEPEGEAAAPPKQTLKIPEVLAELESAAKPLNVRVTYEAIGGELGAGGLCKVKGQWRVIIDKRTTPSERVSVLAPALARFDFASVPLSPQVRELLTRVAPAPPPAEASAEVTAEDSAATADSAAVSEPSAAGTEAAAAESTADPGADSPDAAGTDSLAGAEADSPGVAGTDSFAEAEADSANVAATDSLAATEADADTAESEDSASGASSYPPSPAGAAAGAS